MITMRSKNWRDVAGVLALLAAGAVLLIIYSAREKPLDKESVVRQFNKLYHDSKQYDGTTWLGVKMMQNPCDVWMIQEIVWQTKPDFIIETGTAHGGSSLYFALLLSQVNRGGKVITVDIDPQTEDASKFAAFRDYVEVIKGDSVGPEVIDRIAERVKGHTVLVTLDSDHRKDHVLKELKLYSKFVSKDSYLIVQDTNMNGHPAMPGWGPGPMEAVQEFLTGNKDFVVDRDMERHMLTFFPSGYLKRVR